MLETNENAEALEATDESLLEGEAKDEQKDDSREESDKELDPVILQKQLKEKQKREISLTKRLREAEDKLKKHDEEKLTEAEKQKLQLEELTNKSAKHEGSIKNLLLQGKLASLKSDFGIRSMNLITRLIDVSNLEFDIDDELSVSGVEDELKRLKKEDPDLFIKGGTDGGRGVNDRAVGVDMNAIIRGGR